MKKIIINYLIFYLLFLGATNLSAQYCMGGGPSQTTGYYFDSLGLTGDGGSIISYRESCPSVTGVNNQTSSQSISVTAGNTYTGTVRFGDCFNASSAINPINGSVTEVWVDWNQNDIFDAAETIYLFVDVPPYTETFSFTVPTYAHNGTTRMRMMQLDPHANGGNGSIDPCASLSDGSVLDVSIVVSGGSPCPQPTNINATSTTATSFDLSWTQSGSPTSWEIAYIDDPFTPPYWNTIISTNTNPYNLTGLTQNTTYYFSIRSICGTNDTSNWRNSNGFTTSPPPPADLIITEIMYNPPESGIDSLEFIEIYNNGPTATNLNNYTMSGVTYTFPTVSLAAGAYYVIAVDSAAFNNVYGVTADGIFTGGLNNNGEAIIIRTPTGAIADSVRYDDGGVWTNTPDGNGPSLILCDTATDNADGNNWSASATSTGVTVNGNIVMASPGVGNTCPPPAMNVAVASFLSLDTTYCNVATISGSVIITNMTANDATSVPYSITANGLPLAVDTIPLLAGNASDTITVGPFPAATGIANILATTNLAGDNDASNDSLWMMVFISNTAAASSTTAAISCNGDSTGEVTAVGTNGLGNYNYAWGANTGNAATAVVPNLPTGTYTVIITDSIGCSDSSTVTLTEPTAIALTDSVTNVSCNGDSTGMAMVSVTGGTPTYSFAWPNGDTLDTAINLPAGAYTVTVTDANGCLNSSTITLTEPTAIALTDSVTNVLCNGDSSGMAMITATGGTPTYSFTWSNGDTLNTSMNLPSGAYTVTVTDANGCLNSSTVTLTEPTAIALTDSVTNLLCKGDSSGMAMVIVTGGTPTYSFAWSNGDTLDTAINLPAGAYTVTVTDANGCMNTITSTVTQPASALAANITDNGDGTAIAVGTGGTTPYTFLWDAAAANQTTDTATALIHNGTYGVTITDANGCTDTASILINFVSVNNIATISNLNMFPNPTSNNVFVELELVENATVEISIMNAVGQLVLSNRLGNVIAKKVELNTSNLPSGIYMVQFNIDDQQFSKKLIVHKQ